MWNLLASLLVGCGGCTNERKIEDVISISRFGESRIHHDRFDRFD
jgi:hypothetical protein